MRIRPVCLTLFATAALVVSLLPAAVSAQIGSIPNQKLTSSTAVIDNNPVAGTYYNASALKTNGAYYLFVHTGWIEAGCSPIGGVFPGDQVLVYRSLSPTSGFSQVGHLTTCDPNTLWGMGEVIEYGGQYLTTYDHSTSGDDTGKFRFYLAPLSSTNLTQWQSGPFLFADSSPIQKIIIDPVIYPVSSYRVGVFFRYANTDFTNVKQGHMFIDFAMSGGKPVWNDYTVSVRNDFGGYTTLPANRKINFPLGAVGGLGEIEINRVLKKGPTWLLFYKEATPSASGPVCSGLSEGSTMKFRTVTFDSSGVPTSFGSPQPLASTVSSSPLPRRGRSSVGFPSPINDGWLLRLYWSQDNACAGGFGNLDIQHGLLSP
ncbi:MAG: hypothetical protein AAGD01_09420 [Acidobacteriota bacterium]